MVSAAFPVEMSNLAIHRSAHGPGGMVPPGLEHDYALVRQLPIFDGIPDQDLIAAMKAGGISQRAVERDMFVLDPIGLAHGQPAPVIYIARGQIAAAVFQDHDLAERRTWQLRHDQM